MDPLSKDTRAQVSTLENLVGKANTDRILTKIASAAGRDAGMGSVATDLADMGGIDPAVSKRIAEEVVQDLDGKLSLTLTESTGLSRADSEAVLDWCYANLPRTHVAALLQGARYGDTGALTSAWEQYRLKARKQDNRS